MRIHHNQLHINTSFKLVGDTNYLANPPQRFSKDEFNKKNNGGFQSGQMEQTVNLPLIASVVQIHHHQLSG